MCIAPNDDHRSEPDPSAGTPRQPGVSVVDAAIAYIRRGFRVVPVRPHEKQPIPHGWPELCLTEFDVSSFFGNGENIGLILGEPSRWLVDVDLDCPEALALADHYLPPTGAITGRASMPRSHRWYIARGAMNKPFRDSYDRSSIVEIRSTGTQTLVGPSIHPSGESYDMLLGEPAEVSAEELAKCVSELSAAVMYERHGAVESSPKPAVATVQLAPSNDSVEDVERRASRYLAKMPGSISGSGGHDRAYHAACVLVHGFLLPPEKALQMLREDFNPRCEPPWSRKELEHKVRDAATKPHLKPAGWLRDAPIDPVKAGSAVGQTVKNDAGLPRIEIGTDEHRVIDEAIAVLASAHEVFQRGGQLVEVVVRPSASDQAKACIRYLDEHRLRDLLTRCAQLGRLKKDQWHDAHPIKWLVAGIMSRKVYPGIRELNSIAFAPVLRPDGSIAHINGYDAATKTWIALDEEFPQLPEVLDHEDAWGAVEKLFDITGEFPFASRAHRVAFLSAMITPIARSAFVGPAPMFVLDANTRASGKTTLVQVVSLIVKGCTVPATSYVHESNECRKQVTGIVMAGESIVLLDNVRGEFGNDVFDRLLTTERWSDRMLGGNELIDEPCRATWFVTGNNLCVAADTMRRTVHIRLESDLERPEDRGGFKYPDILRHVREHRQTLYMACITIVAAYIRAGRPSANLTPFGSFGGWSNLVREAVAWATSVDPCSTRTQFENVADASREQLLALFEAFQAVDPNGNGVTASAIVDACFPTGSAPPSDPAWVQMRCAIELITSARPGRPPNALVVGKRLGGFRDRRLGDHKFEAGPSRVSKGTVWRVVPNTQKAAS